MITGWCFNQNVIANTWAKKESYYTCSPSESDLAVNYVYINSTCTSN